MIKVDKEVDELVNYTTKLHAALDKVVKYHRYFTGRKFFRNENEREANNIAAAALELTQPVVERLVPPPKLAPFTPNTTADEEDGLIQSPPKLIRRRPERAHVRGIQIINPTPQKRIEGRKRNRELSSWDDGTKSDNIKKRIHFDVEMGKEVPATTSNTVTGTKQFPICIDIPEIKIGIMDTQDWKDLLEKLHR